MPARKPDQPLEYKVGDRVILSLSNGRIEETTVKAVIQDGAEARLQVDCGLDETALVYLWQIRPQAS